MNIDEFKKINYKKYRYIFLYLGLVIIGISITFEIIGYGLSIPILVESFKFLFPIGLAIWSLVFACHAIVLSEEASNIAESSDKKMKSISNGDFYEITYRFWDRAPHLYYEQSFEVRDTYSWQLGNLFRHAEKLKDWTDPDIQDKLIKEFKIFLERLRATKCKKYWGEVKNYMVLCSIAIDFKTKNSIVKNELINELGKWIGKKNKKESNKKYLQRKSNEFSKMKNKNIF